MKVEIVRRDLVNEDDGFPLRTLAILELSPIEIPRQGDYINISEAEGGENLCLVGFGANVMSVGWHYKGKVLYHVIIEVDG